MRIIFTGIICSICLILIFSVPAFSRPKFYRYIQMEDELKKPVSAEIWGDEFGMYLSYDNMNYLIIPDGKDYYYARLVNNRMVKTNLIAGKVSPDTNELISKNILNDKSFIEYRNFLSEDIPNPLMIPKSMNSGNVTIKLIFVEFKDARSTGYPKSDYIKMFSSTDTYDQLSPDGDPVFGSIRDYFFNISSGKVKISAEILNVCDSEKILWVQLPKNKDYYHQRTATFFKQQVLEYLKFQQNTDILFYSNFGIIYAGDTFWNGGLHPSATKGFNYIESELYRGKFNHIGGHCHEIAHAYFSLNDHYKSTTPGTDYKYWGLMAWGSWNGIGPDGEIDYELCNLPAPISPPLRKYKNWLNFTEISTKRLNLPLVYTEFMENNYRIPWQTPDSKYYATYIENRQRTHWNRALPDGGILVWNVYEFAGIRGENYQIELVNSGGPDKYVSEAAFPGVKDCREVNDFTRSASMKWRTRNEKNTNIIIRNISGNGIYMTADISPYWYGTISDYCDSWIGDVVVGENIIIGKNASFNISKNTGIYFFPEKGLSVQGSLSANQSVFTGIDSAEGWNGIFFSDKSRGIIGGCIIEKVNCYGSAALKIYNADVEIKNSIIENNIGECAGIYVNGWNAKATIYNNVIRKNSFHSIWVSRGRAYIVKNIISPADGYDAIHSYDQSLIRFGILDKSNDYLFGYNDLSGGRCGIFAARYSSVYANFGEDYGAFNDLSGHTFADAYAGNHSVIHAALNWWGEYPVNSNKIIADHSAIFDDHPLSFNPLDSVQHSKKDSLSASIIDTPHSSLFTETYSLQVERSIKEKAAIYKDVITLSPHSNEAIYSLLELRNMYRENHDQSIFKYFNTMSNINTSTRPVFLEFLMNIHYSEGRYETALDFIDKIEQNYKGSEFGRHAEITKFYVYFDQQQFEKAYSVLMRLKKKNPEDDSIVLALDLMRLSRPGIVGAPEQSEPKTDQDDPDSDLALNNFPNPFNSSTTIRFSLPANSHISLVVYNILGQKVRTIISEFRTAGLVSVQFDGKNDKGSQLPSGAYICRLKSARQIAHQKILILR